MILGFPMMSSTDIELRLGLGSAQGCWTVSKSHSRTQGDRLHESRWINSTLTTIFQCIKATGENQEALGKAARLRSRKPVALKPVPCRDSKVGATNKSAHILNFGISL